jgi:hypothetical protein
VGRSPCWSPELLSRALASGNVDPGRTRCLFTATLRSSTCRGWSFGLHGYCDGPPGQLDELHPGSLPSVHAPKTNPSICYLTLEPPGTVGTCPNCSPPRLRLFFAWARATGDADDQHPHGPFLLLALVHWYRCGVAVCDRRPRSRRHADECCRPLMSVPQRFWPGTPALPSGGRSGHW